MSKLLQNGFQIVSETEIMTVEGGLSYDDCFAPPHVAPDPVPPKPKDDTGDEFKPKLPKYTGGGGSPEHYLAD